MANPDEAPVLSEEELRKKVSVYQHPVVAAKMTQLRRAETSSKHFRELLREVTEYLGYRATEDLALKDLKVKTPLAEFDGHELASTVSLVPVMRSGLGMVDAMLEILPSASVFHLGIYRNKAQSVPLVYYNNLPGEFSVDRVIVLEPLIATAKTMNAVLDILEDSKAKEVHVLSLIATCKGLSEILHRHPDVKIHTAAIDPDLSESGYILPGLGDSGERLNNTGRPVGQESKPRTAQEPAAKRAKTDP